MSGNLHNEGTMIFLVGSDYLHSYTGGCVRRHQQHNCTTKHAHEVGRRKMQGSFVDFWSY